MRKLVGAFVCWSMVLSLLSAQEKTGTITGTVVDDCGNLLPEVSLILSGGPMGAVGVPAVTGADGKFRFQSLLPDNDYKIEAMLLGFKTKLYRGLKSKSARTPISASPWSRPPYCMRRLKPTTLKWPSC
jgi:Carboxypeptidase regulatory-like domain